MTSTMLRVPGNGELLTPETCRTGSGVFDGRLRYDLKLDYKRMENVKAEKGYHGPAWSARCISRRSRAISRIAPSSNISPAQRNIEIAFVPIAGTRILVPFRMTIPTPFGPAVLEATKFNTMATPPRVAKTQ